MDNKKKPIHTSKFLEEYLKIKMTKLREKELLNLKKTKKIRIMSQQEQYEKNNISTKMQTNTSLQNNQEKSSSIMMINKEKYRNKITGNTKEKEKITPKKKENNHEEIVHSNNSIYIEQKYKEELNKKKDELKKNLNNLYKKEI